MNGKSGREYRTVELNGDIEREELTVIAGRKVGGGYRTVRLDGDIGQ